MSIVAQIIVFMGLQLPALGTDAPALVRDGFVNAHWDAPASQGTQAYVKASTSKRLGRVTVEAIISEGGLESILIGCARKLRCAAAVPSSEQCHKIDDWSWRCDRSGMNFDVHSCARRAYLITKPNVPFPKGSCAALR